MFEIGRLCMKIAGRESGKYCVIVKKMDDKFVMVTGPRDLTSVKRRRCNMNHLEPMIDVLKIKSDASDSDVLKADQEANLTKKLGLGPKEKPKAAKKAVPKLKEVAKAPKSTLRGTRAQAKPKAKPAKKATAKPKAPKSTQRGARAQTKKSAKKK